MIINFRYLLILACLGFSIEAAASGDIICTDTSSNESSGMLFDSGGAAGNYSNNEDCSFLIQPTGGGNITLTFASFNLEANFDFFEVYDGTNSSGTQLGRTSDTTIPSPFTATSGAMFIRFTSDFSVISPGFEASWTTSIPTAPEPVAEWRLEESNWNGSPGEVLDNSANGLNGFAVSVGGNFTQPETAAPALAGNPGTCGYGAFAGANRGFLRINDPGRNSILDLRDNLTVTAWVNPRVRRRGLMTIASKDENWEFHLRRNGRVNWWWGGRAKQLNSTRSVPLNSWSHIAITYRSGEQFIYINGVPAGTRNTSGQLTVQNDPVLIGTDLGFNSRTFDGLIDEVRIYNQTLSSSEVQAVFKATHPCSSSVIVDHYSITAPSTAVSCEPIDITITAHDASHNPVDAQSAVVSLDTSTGRGNWSGAGIDNTITNDGLATLDFTSGISAITVQLSHPDLAGSTSNIVNIGASDGSANEHSSEDPDIEISQSGLRFIRNNGTSITTNLPTQIAGSVSSTSPLTDNLFIEAIQVDSDAANPLTAACTGAYTTGDNVNLNIGGECVNPTTCQLNQMQINGNNIPISDNGSATNSINVTFTTASRAPISINYDDVGQIRLHAEDPVKLLEGSSNPFVVKPHTMVVTVAESTGSPTINGLTTTTPTPRFIPAATNFRVVVESRNASGNLTPNYGNETTPESVAISFAALTFPTGTGTSNGTLTGGVFSGANGVFQSTTAQWSEVGTLTVTADIGDGNYLGADTNGVATLTPSDNIGRFYPADFTLSGIALNTFCEASSSNGGLFSYLSQPNLRFNYNLTARNVLGATVTNYDNASLNYATGIIHYHAENADSGIDLNPVATPRVMLSPTSPVNWNNGVYQLTNIPGQLNRNGAPDGPFNTVQFSLDITDPDGASLIATDLNQNPTTTGDCLATNNCTSAGIGATQQFRYGRVIIEDANGPESAPLPVTFGSQFWGGNNFVDANTDDCSTLAFGALNFGGNNPIVNPQPVTVGGGTSTGTFNAAGAFVTTSNGGFELNFSAPNTAMQFEVSADLTNYPWFRFDWNQDGDFNNDTALPAATINFGSYRGHDRVIYWREQF